MSEIERTERMTALIKEIPESLALLESSLPKHVDGFALSQKSKLPWKVLLYREALIWRIVELGRSAFENLKTDTLVSGIVLTRAAVETSAAIWYLRAKVEAVVDSKALGNVDEYLMKLSMGNATGWPKEDSSRGALLMPRPIKIKAFLNQAEKDIPGYKHQYGVLSEYTHPNWAGTVLLYSKTDQSTAITALGANIRTAENAKGIGVVNLSVALRMFQLTYDRISDLLPAFISVCAVNSFAKENHEGVL